MSDSVPKQLSEVENIERLEMPIIRVGIYFLVKNSEVVYVGQSTNISVRVAQHLGDKEFDDVYFVRVAHKHLSAVERGIIKAIKPRLNRPQDRLGSPLKEQEQAMKKYGLNSYAASLAQGRLHRPNHRHAPPRR